MRRGRWVFYGLAAVAIMATLVFVWRRRHRTTAIPEVPDVPAVSEALQVVSRDLSIGRRYLAVSPARPGRALPIVLVLHGDNGSAESMRAFTAFDAASGAGAHVAYAQVARRFWEEGSDGDYRSERAYLREIVADLAELRGADPTRLFVLGWSSGAYLAQTFACGEPKVVALALVAAWGEARCASESARRPMLVVHSTHDDEHRIAHGDALVAALRAERGCGSVGEPTLVPPCVSYPRCTVPLAYCRVEGGSHYPWSRTARAAWAFFSERLP